MSLIPPYGGELVDLMAEGERREALLRSAAVLPALTLNSRQLCDLEQLLNGALSPLRGYMGRADFDRVLTEMQLVDGTFWPLPVALDIGPGQASSLQPGNRIALCDSAANRLAVLTVSDIWKADREREAHQIHDKEQTAEGVRIDLAQLGSHYAGGLLEGLALPSHEDFSALRLTPAMARESFKRYGHNRVIAFQPCNVMHRAQYEFTRHCSEENDAALMIQAITGEEATPDFFTRIRCLQALMPHYPKHAAWLGLLPLVSRQAGIREVLWRAIVARNHGCSHFIIGGDAGMGDIRRGSDALVPGRIQPLAEHFATIGVEPITFPRMVYVPELEQYMPEEYLLVGQSAFSLSAHELQQRIAEGREEIPKWASFPEVVKELQIRHPKKSRRGFALFISGLTGEGLAELSQALERKLMELTGRPVTLLDGLLSGDLADSGDDRDRIARLAGFVAAEIIRHGGIAVCTLDSPCRETCQAARRRVEPFGGFFEIHVSSGLEADKTRGSKGVYTKARSGQKVAAAENRYHPDLKIAAGATHIADSVDEVIHLLRVEGYLDVA
ncbi:MAG: adenylyl-sulfate kinase [Sulfuricella denitrificans]|nr:adenylyl-sulfate kinase [Sulfuricella denitrificans]